MSKNYVNSCIDKAYITGTVLSVGGNTVPVSDKFVNIVVSTARKKPSTVKDIINVIANKKIVKKVKEGSHVKISGSLQTRTQDRHLYIYVFAEDITVVTPADAEDSDQVRFEGYICKDPILRTTPESNRKICDLILAINDRGYSYYVPCICWNSVAERMAEKVVGDKFYVTGRLQSREYIKNGKTYVINEVSVIHIEDCFTESDDEVED